MVENRDDVIRIVRGLYTAHDRVAEFVAPYESKPSSNSPAEFELSSFPRQESVRTAYSQGLALIEVAADQLVAFTKTVTEPVQTIAPWTCVRSLLEASALACWLFDNSVDARERVHISLAFRYEGLSQQLKFIRATDPTADTTKAVSRLEHVEGVAIELGFTAEKRRKGGRLGVGKRMPATTEVIRLELNEEATYRLLSAVAHAHHWALSRLGFQRVDRSRVEALGISTTDMLGHPFEKALSPSSVAFLCATAVISLAKAMWQEVLLFGWDVHLFKQVLESISDDLEILSNSRFWRTHETWGSS